MRMKLASFALYFSVLHSSIAWSQDHLSKQLERINFFPESDAYLDMGYKHQRLNIETPQDSVLTKEVKNHANLIHAAYSQRMARKMFLGARLFFEQASENGVMYGVPLRRRFDSAGFKEPEVFMTYRLRHQRDDRGLIDFHASYSPYMGLREIGNQKANRLHGRSMLKAAISHGLWEEEWEFRTWLGINYFGQGKERNDYSGSSFKLRPYREGEFIFSSQYRISPWLFVYGSIGIIYTGIEKISEKNGIKREIKAGTGSRFELGIKKPLNPWSLVELGYALRRNEYFVKSDEANLEGDVIQQQLLLSYKMAF
jgi:hypothetical protein